MEFKEKTVIIREKHRVQAVALKFSDFKSVLHSLNAK